MNDHALELDGAAADAQLNSAKSAIGRSHANNVMVNASINVSAAEIGPAFSCVGGDTDCKNKEHRDCGCKTDFLRHVSLLLWTESGRKSSPKWLDKAHPAFCNCAQLELYTGLTPRRSAGFPTHTIGKPVRSVLVAKVRRCAQGSANRRRRLIRRSLLTGRVRWILYETQQ